MQSRQDLTRLRIWLCRPLRYQDVASTEVSIVDAAIRRGKSPNKNGAVTISVGLFQGQGCQDKGRGCLDWSLSPRSIVARIVPKLKI